MNLITPRSVLPIAMAAYLITIAIIVIPLLQYTQGAFPYPIDDTCIHLAIAKNLAIHHVWGVSPVEFTSAASSILYPLILAGVIKIFGAHLVIPFLLNVLFSLALLAVLRQWLARHGISPLAQLLVLIAVIFLTPLPVLTMCGMEHSLQFLVTFLFLSRLCTDLERLGQPGTSQWKLSWQTYLYATLMVMTRYEGIPLLALACLLLLLHRKIFTALQLGLYPVVPIVIFGLYSVAHGNFFFPNSVLLKSGAPPLTFDGLYEYFTSGLFSKLFFSMVGYNTVATQRLLFLLPLAFLLLHRRLPARSADRYLLILLMAMAFVHLALTGYAAFPRYEAYLIGASVALLGMLAAKYGKPLLEGSKGPAWWVGCLAVLFLTFPLLLRSSTAFGKLKEDGINNYHIQYQLGQFLHQYYNTTPIAVEALGGASFYSDSKKLDIVGLGDIAVARSMRNHYYSVDFLDSLSRREGIKIAAVSAYSTPPQLTARWRRVGSWQTPLEFGGYYVSFYAVDSSMAPGLKKNLVEYQKHLPKGENVIYD